MSPGQGDLAVIGRQVEVKVSLHTKRRNVSMKKVQDFPGLSSITATDNTSDGPGLLDAGGVVEEVKGFPILLVGARSGKDEVVFGWIVVRVVVRLRQPRLNLGSVLSLCKGFFGGLETLLGHIMEVYVHEHLAQGQAEKHESKAKENARCARHFARITRRHGGIVVR